MMAGLRRGLRGCSRKRLRPRPAADLWNQGSVVRSWLLELAVRPLSRRTRLDKITGYVDDTGEGRWTVQAGDRARRALPVIAESLFARFVAPDRLVLGQGPGRAAQRVRRPRG